MYAACRDRDRDRGRDRERDRERMPPPPPPPAQPDAPELGAVCRGTVSSVMEFGCFVELKGFRRRFEGLVHVANMSKRPISSAKEFVKRGQEVRMLFWVVVFS